MRITNTTRRSFLGHLSALAATAAACAPTTSKCPSSGQTPPSADRPVNPANSNLPASTQGANTVSVGKHKPVPLSFDPSKLRGLSEPLIRSHHETNYTGAVKNLNKVETLIASLANDTPGFELVALREKELMFRNSASLHELYFGNLSPDNSRSAIVDSKISQYYSTFSAFEARFRAAALGLGGGSGWVILCSELQSHNFQIVTATNHTQYMVNALPILVLDMYEHSYHLDYGAAHAKYIDAFFSNINWATVQQRITVAEQWNTHTH